MEEVFSSCSLSCPVWEWHVDHEAHNTQTAEVLYGENGMAATLMRHIEEFEAHKSELDPKVAVEIKNKLILARKMLNSMMSGQDSLEQLTETNFDYELMERNCQGKIIEADPDDPNRFLVYCGSTAISDVVRNMYIKKVTKRES